MCYHCLLELETKVREVYTITEKVPTRAFALLKAFTFENLLRHFARQMLTHGKYT